MLLACFSKDNCCYCLVREMEVINITNVPATNDFRCPLLFMTSRINTINSLSVITLASIIHKCTDKCVFAQTTTTHRVECENIETQKLTLNHDYTNSCYCLKSVILFIELVFCLYNLVTFLYFLRLQLYNHFLSKYMLLYMHVINANGTTIIKYETGL